MQDVLGRSFYTIVRATEYLNGILVTDPFAGYALPSGSKRVVSFMREIRKPGRDLPLSADGASVLCLVGREAFSAYLPSEKGPVFMKLIETAFGVEVTTRTWDTLRKCAAA